jgi:DegV family protein with EDD domain
LIKGRLAFVSGGRFGYGVKKEVFKKEKREIMGDFIISCCSTADLTKQHFEDRGISYICFHYELDGKEYADDLGQSMDFHVFYQAMARGAQTKTSQVNADEFEQYFEKFLKEGKDVLHVTLSSGISGVLNSAMIAKEELEAKYPQRKILVVDSLGASSGYGLLMDRLADLRDEGKSMEEIYDWAIAHRLYLQHWFFSTDLTFYIKGGRISKAAGLIGGVLNICPLLNVDNNGKLIPRFKIRTKKKVIRTIVDKMEEYAENGLDYSGKCYISQSDCYEDAKQVADLIEARFPKLNGKVEINSVGTTIGSHTGPGTVALFFWGSERID